MGFEVEGVNPWGKLEKTWREVTEKDRWMQQLNNRMTWIIVNGGN